MGSASINSATAPEPIGAAGGLFAVSRASAMLAAMRLGLNTDLRGLRPERPPVLLLGGLNLVRALGMAGIPAIVASSDARSPALTSRYCVGRCPLPPLEPPQAALDTLFAAGERLADT